MSSSGAERCEEIYDEADDVFRRASTRSQLIVNGKPRLAGYNVNSALLILR